MPFFLSDEFKTILEEKINKTGGLSEGTDPLGGTGNGGMLNQTQGLQNSQMYRSQFLKDKLIEQNEKKKRDRKTKKGGPGENMSEHNLFGGG